MQVGIETLLTTVINEATKTLGTSIPAHILAFDPETQLAQAQIGIVRIDVNGKEFTAPPIIECPVVFAGGDYMLEHQVNAGDECLLIFSQRCIDGWLTTGGVAQQPIIRFHDFQDAIVITGLRSQPNKIQSFANDGARLRNKSGDQYCWLKSSGEIELKNGAGSIKLGADGSVNINGLTIDVGGNLSTSGKVEAGGVSLGDHVHGGVSGGDGFTGKAQ